MGGFHCLLLSEFSFEEPVHFPSSQKSSQQEDEKTLREEGNTQTEKGG